MHFYILFLPLFLCTELTRQEKLLLDSYSRKKKIKANGERPLLVPMTRTDSDRGGCQDQFSADHFYVKMLLTPDNKLKSYPHLRDPDTGIILNTSEEETTDTDFSDTDSERPMTAVKKVYLSVENSLSEESDNGYPVRRPLGVFPDWTVFNRKSERSRESMFLNTYAYEDTVATGATGEVRLYYKASAPHNKVAVKVLEPKTKELLERSKHFLVSEKNVHRILRESDHHFLMNCYTYFCPGIITYFVTEYIEGVTLDKFLKLKSKLSASKLKIIAAQIFLGIECMHKHRIVHRDIKPKNILIYRKMSVKIIDYGFATEFTSKIRDIFCGTPFYNSPEVLEHKPYGFEVDWWAFGVILYYLHHKNTPYEFYDIKSLESFKMRGNYRLKSTGDTVLDDLISKLLNINQAKRLCGAGDEPYRIRRHPYFRTFLSSKTVCCE